MRRQVPLVLLLATMTTACLAAQRSTETMLDERHQLRSGASLTMDLADADLQLDRSLSPGQVIVTLNARPRDMDWARDRYRDMQLTVTESSSGLEISSREIRWDWRSSREHHGMTVLVRVGVPEEANVRARTGDGDIRAGDLSGDLEMVSEDGDILADALSGSHLLIRSEDGDIRVTRLSSADATVSTGDGDVIIEELASGLNARTGDGDLRIRIASAGPVELQTGDGDIMVNLPSTLAAELDLEGGDLEISGITVMGDVKSSRIRGTMNGGGPVIRARTGDGEIAVRGEK